MITQIILQGKLHPTFGTCVWLDSIGIGQTMSASEVSVQVLFENEITAALIAGERFGTGVIFSFEMSCGKSCNRILLLLDLTQSC